MIWIYGMVFALYALFVLVGIVLFILNDKCEKLSDRQKMLESVSGDIAQRCKKVGQTREKNKKAKDKQQLKKEQRQ